MWNLKPDTNELIYETDIEDKLMFTKGERVQEGINYKPGINRYTLQCIK